MNLDPIMDRFYKRGWFQKTKAEQTFKNVEIWPKSVSTDLSNTPNKSNLKKCPLLKDLKQR